MVVSTDRLRTLLATATPATVERFVAALWERRGWRTTRDDGVVTLTDGTGTERTLVVSHPGAAPPGEADILVTVDTDAPADTRATVLTVADLAELLRYALEESTAERLLVTHFDYDPTRTPPTETDEAPAEGGGVSRRWVLAAAGLGVAAGAGLGEAARRVGGILGGGSEASASTETPVAPGVTSEDGVVDGAVLGDAHAAALEGRSYELATTRTVYGPDNKLRSSLSLDVSVGSGSRYLARAATAGPAAPVLLGTPPASARYWSDGELYLRAFDGPDGTTYNTFEPPSRQTSTPGFWVETVPFGGASGSARRYFGTVLGAVPTALVDETPGDPDRFLLVSTRDRPTGAGDRLARVLGLETVETVAFTVRIDGRGLVRWFRGLHTGAAADGTGRRTVHRTVTYAGLGETTVDRPAWYDRALEN